MDRKKRREPDWGVDEEGELLRDSEMASQFGFRPIDITAARHDLETLSWTFQNNPFEIYEVAGKSLGRIASKIANVKEELGRVCSDIDIQEIFEVVDRLGDTVSRLSEIKSRLPRRPRALPEIAATFIMAVWSHVDRVDGSPGRRELKFSFYEEEPIHQSMKFIVLMMSRSSDPLLKSLSRSTIKRALTRYKMDPIPPGQVYAFRGDRSFLCE